MKTFQLSLEQMMLVMRRCPGLWKLSNLSQRTLEQAMLMMRGWRVCFRKLGGKL